jgi:hypothetical protein
MSSYGRNRLGMLFFCSLSALLWALADTGRFLFLFVVPLLEVETLQAVRAVLRK